MRVENFKNRDGRPVANQFLIFEDENPTSGNAVVYFQSYETVIAKRDKFRAGEAKRQIWLDRDGWDYSTTTGKYRNQFLDETKKETEKKIKSGEYILTDLNEGGVI